MDEAKDRLTQAKDPETDPAVLAELILDRSTDISQAAAKNPSTPGQALADAVFMGGLDDSYKPPLREMAKNPNTPPETLAFLAESRDPFNRVFVAKNPSAPKSVIEMLCRDECGFVRRLAADPRRDGRYVAPSVKSLLVARKGGTGRPSPKESRYLSV